MEKLATVTLRDYRECAMLEEERKELTIKLPCNNLEELTALYFGTDNWEDIKIYAIKSELHLTIWSEICGCVFELNDILERLTKLIEKVGCQAGTLMFLVNDIMQKKDFNIFEAVEHLEKKVIIEVTK